MGDWEMIGIWGYSLGVIEIYGDGNLLKERTCGGELTGTLLNYYLFISFSFIFG